MRVRFTSPVLLSALVLLCSTPRLPAAGVSARAAPQQAGWRVEVREGQSTRSTLTINNRCAEPHLFLVKSDAEHLRFEQPTDAVLIAPGSSQQLAVLFDATRLKSKVYKSKVVVECRDCRGSRCTQDRDEIPVVLTVTKPPEPDCGRLRKVFAQ